MEHLLRNLKCWILLNYLSFIANNSLLDKHKLSISHTITKNKKLSKTGVPQTTQISKLEIIFSKFPSKLEFDGKHMFLRNDLWGALQIRRINIIKCTIGHYYEQDEKRQACRIHDPLIVKQRPFLAVLVDMDQPFIVVHVDYLALLIPVNENMDLSQIDPFIYRLTSIIENTSLCKMANI